MFTHGQNYAYQVMNYGYNSFLTGDAGTGKSYVLVEFVNNQREKGNNVMVVAPTGLAAYNVNGVTIHRAFNAPVAPITSMYDTNKIDDTIIETDILVIDEISTCRIDLFEYMIKKVFTANTIRKNRGRKPVQIIVCGDFFQLPPVITDYDRVKLNEYYGKDIGQGFCFESQYWKILDFKVIILTEVVRQDNKEFIEKLNRLRVGDRTHLDYFYKNSNKNEILYAVNLYGTNKEVDKRNQMEIDRIPGQLFEYYDIMDEGMLASECRTEEVLRLKVGARVMTTLNSKEGTYINGSIATVVDCQPDLIGLKFINGHYVYIQREEFEVYQYELETDTNGNQRLERKVIGCFKQFPIRLAYAITIHKSQGQTFDAINLNPYSWDCGQLYVAISRVRDLNQLHFNYEPDMRYAVTSLNVIKFYNEIVKTANQNVEPRKETVKTMTKEEKAIQDDMDKLEMLFKNLGR